MLGVGSKAPPAESAEWSKMISRAPASCAEQESYLLESQCLHSFKVVKFSQGSLTTRTRRNMLGFGERCSVLRKILKVTKVSLLVPNEKENLAKTGTSFRKGDPCVE